jgi:hypothetical protein
MTKGVLLFAYNNSHIDYVRLAIFSANRIKEHLNVPVTLISNDSSLNSSAYSLDVFDNVLHFDETISNKKYFNDGLDKSQHLDWHNAARFSAYTLSPYEQTLVLDVDYVINSNNLDKCWDQPHDFLIYKDSLDFAARDNKEFKNISDYSIDFYWATAFYFRKTESTEYLFRLVEHIKENWSFYKVLYQLHSTNFRNDFAFSIAIHMMNGFTQGEFAKKLPGKMYYTLDTDILTNIENDKMTFLTHRQQSSDSYVPLAISGLDIHVMNKYSLLRCIDNE